jgi:hypothetical protein
LELELIVNVDIVIDWAERGQSIRKIVDDDVRELVEESSELSESLLLRDIWNVEVVVVNIEERVVGFVIYVVVDARDIRDESANSESMSFVLRHRALDEAEVVEVLLRL